MGMVKSIFFPTDIEEALLREMAMREIRENNRVTFAQLVIEFLCEGFKAKYSLPDSETFDHRRFKFRKRNRPMTEIRDGDHYLRAARMVVEKLNIEKMEDTPDE